MCVRGLGKGLGIALVLSFLVSCNSTMPSAGLQSRIKLPIPASVTVLARAERLSTKDQGEVYELSPQSLIVLAFNLQPDIKRAISDSSRKKPATTSSTYRATHSLRGCASLTSSANTGPTKLLHGNVSM